MARGRSSGDWVVGLGGGLQGDLVAERFELVDQAASLAVGVVACWCQKSIVGAELRVRRASHRAT
jgi:hypothetical protein